MIETVTKFIKVENMDILLHFTLLQEQIILVVTDRELNLTNIHMAMQTKYEDFPTATCIKDDQGRQDEQYIQTLARSLCKKNKINVCLSYNLESKQDPGFYLMITKLINEQVAEVLSKKSQN
ncbi:hypothetical protein TTHERM_000405549 (macronuclear) [Tetrahymena thermophila SB210]|uniref:Proteasome assembly chaperone 3 n=1 Tax=Tetrahymena thermophila (strain SB210) TaxID=312017 RepID=W7XE44_TETTS|nr:hypothetical protein TTHERM_000405549 [Tetrahymena thermophila SB210]EWS74803.1 hypothetical protein TTHERM_000405549 [Tetrahymena thermophila SB210]|eukprot:XP_012652696.1 hypothetical protein TTHERM_000405549 [Tetrahymena thermophila SB210]